MDNKEYFDKCYRPEKRHRWKSTLGQDICYCIFVLIVSYVVMKS